MNGKINLGGKAEALREAILMGVKFLKQRGRRREDTL